MIRLDVAVLHVARHCEGGALDARVNDQSNAEMTAAQYGGMAPADWIESAALTPLAVSLLKADGVAGAIPFDVLAALLANEKSREVIEHLIAAGFQLGAQSQWTHKDEELCPNR